MQLDPNIPYSDANMAYMEAVETCARLAQALVRFKYKDQNAADDCYDIITSRAKITLKQRNGL